VRVLLQSMPPDAACRWQPGQDRTPWHTTEELLAGLLEEVSVLTSDRRRREPLRIPRPNAKPQPDSPTQVTGAKGLIGLARARGLMGPASARGRGGG
jgi:hypothetical protein